MYLKKIKIQNFRNFGTEDNEVEFVSSVGIQKRVGSESGDDLQKDNEQIYDENINIASVTTLIVGKNNSGKTTIITALDKLINKSSEPVFSPSDFNYYYLNECINAYIDYGRVEIPFMEFVVVITLEDESTDSLTNLVPFMLLEDVKDSELEICIRYEVSEESIYTDQIIEVLNKYRKEKTQFRFQKFLSCIENTAFKLNFYDKNGTKLEGRFKLSNLINLKVISANLVKKDTGLSEAFNRIVTYRYEHVLGTKKDEVEESFDKMNKDITDTIQDHHTNEINIALGSVVSENHMKVNLSADITLEKVMNRLIKYEYVEKDFNIPEDQFGLGYTNLMMIIAALLDYIERYPDTKYNNKINLVAIEEPETYMHPQMQELFINNINDVLRQLIGSKNKYINSQLIITTHSSHILNSKIHRGNSFDNINYVYKKDNQSRVVKLNNAIVMPEGVTDEDSADFRFLKKHIKFKVSELFFSDAVIFVEGFSEDTILPFYIENNKELNKYYISIFSINGAHGYLYRNLIKALGVPTLIITDLDIKREDSEKEKQIDNLAKRETTNKTLINFKGNSDLSVWKDYIEEENLYLTYQGKIEGYYATSFEEAFILTNYNNTILNKVLKNLKPQIYNDIVGKILDLNKNKEQSSKWQVKLSNDKGKFASELLYSMIGKEEDEELPKLPKYIANGLQWLVEKLEEGR